MTRFNREAYELELHRRACAGDAGAKRTIEVRELREKADENARQLRDKAEKGDAQAMSALRRLASGTASPAPHVAINGITRGDVERAATAATKAERERWAGVFASDASKGRERACANVLSNPKGWSAATIINELNATAKANREGADVVWDRVHGAASGTAPDKGKPVASDPWAKAYAGTGQ